MYRRIIRQPGIPAPDAGQMVELDEDCTNQLFQTLADWEHQLQHSDIDLEELTND